MAEGRQQCFFFLHWIDQYTYPWVLASKYGSYLSRSEVWKHITMMVKLDILTMCSFNGWRQAPKMFFLNSWQDYTHPCTNIHIHVHYFSIYDFLKHITKVVNKPFWQCAALMAKGRKLNIFFLDGVDQYTHPWVFIWAFGSYSSRYEF